MTSAVACYHALTDEDIRSDLSARGVVYATSRTWRAAAEQHLALWRSLA